MRVRTALGLLLALGVVLLVVVRPGPPPQPSARQLIALRQTQTLQALLKRAEGGPLLASADVVIAIDQHLVQDLLTSVLPIEADLGKGYRVRIEGAIAQFEDGLALVRFDGRATMGGADTFADVSLFAGIDRVQLEPAAGRLHARLTVFATDAPRVRVAGRRAQVAGLVKRLGPAGLEALASLLPALQIPIVLQGDVDLPALTTDTVRIPAARLRLGFGIREVHVFRGRLWVSVGETGPRSPPAVEALLQAGDTPLAPQQERTLFGMASLGCLRERHRAEAFARAEAGLAQERREAEALFGQKLAADPVVGEALSDSSQVAVELRSDFVERLVQRAASVYLRDVEVDLSHHVVRKDREVWRRTPFGRMRMGTWHAEVSLDRVRGTVHVDPPVVRLRRGNTVALKLPVRLPRTRASVLVRFRWEARGVGNLVCRDFTLERRIEGVVPEIGDVLSGGFVLSTDGQSLVAQPYFEDRVLFVPAELSPQSWEAVRQDLATQDTLLRCGLALHPDRVMVRLREIVARGFHARLPLKLFRPVRLPARFSPAVSLADRQVRLQIVASGTLVTAEGLWARARMHAVHDGAPPRGGDSD